jgi:CheY-like chemotaxis protein
MSELVKSLAMIMDPMPKAVPMVISLERDVPPVIVSDDLKIFRSALNLLSNAIDHTRIGVVWLRIFRKEGSSQLVFECTDTGPDVPVEQYQYLFKPNQTIDGDVQLGLSSLANLINSLDGEYGFSPLGMLTDGKREARRKCGSIFWFSVPLHVPDNAGVENGKDGSVAVLPQGRTRLTRRKAVGTKAPIIPDFPRTPSGAFIPRAASGAFLRNGNSSAFGGRSGSNSSVSSNGQRRLSVQIGDPFQAEALRNSCFRDVFEVEASGQSRMLENTEDSKPSAVPERICVPMEYSNGGPEKNVPTGRKKRALVIEDSLVVRKSLARALNKLGFDVTQAVDGLEGLKDLKENIFDLTLCDFLMPVMDGMDCVKQYRDWEKEHRPWFSQWIVGISAHANANDGGQGITSGMDDFKPKPLSIKALTDIYESPLVVERSKQLDVFEAAISGSSASTTKTIVDIQEIEPGKRAGATALSLERASKRMRSSSEDQTKRLTKPANPVCLMAADKPSRRTNEMLLKMERDNWKVVVVNDGNEALRLLKMRNWDAVLLEDDLPVMDGAACIEAFREWEEENRVNRQCNTILVCSEQIPAPSDISALVQPPTGFDSVLARPLVYTDMEYLLNISKSGGRAYEIVIRDG